jgi:hypothetical protein
VDFSKWREVSTEKKSIAAMLGQVLDTYNIEPYRAASIAPDICESKISANDVQLIWK